MSAISTYLQRILNAIWAKDVRQAIHDAISQCYDDVNKPALQTEAMQAAVQAKIDAGEMAAYTVADGSFAGSKLADGAITTVKIADNAVTAAKLSDDIFASRFYGKKVSIIGDSIDTFNAPGYNIDGYKMYYPALGVTSVEQTWWKQVLNASGSVIEVNASWSGSRVTNTHASYPDFYDRVSVIGSPDLIFVTLGTNDSSNNVALGDYDFETAYSELAEDTFRPAYTKGMKALQSLYPSAVIIAIIEQMEDAYKTSIMHICTMLGIDVIDASDYVGQSGVHPGTLGMNQIARLVLYPTDVQLVQKHFPADAKAVGGHFGNIKNWIIDFNYTVEQGGFYSTGLDTEPTEQNYTKRLRVKEYALTTKKIKVSYTSEKQIWFSVSFYNAPDYATNRHSATSWYDSGYELDAMADYPYVRVCFKASDESAISPSDISDLQIWTYNASGIYDEITNNKNDIKGIALKIDSLLPSEISPIIVQGGLTDFGIETPSSHYNYWKRLRSKDFLTGFGTITISYTATIDLQVSVSFYTDPDYALKRTSYTGWYTSGAKVVVPKESRYMRLLFKKPDGSSVSPNVITEITVATNGAVDYLTDAIQKSVISESENYEITAGGNKLYIHPELLGSLTYLQAFCGYNEYWYSTNGTNISKQDSNFAEIENVELAVGHGNSMQIGTAHKNYAYISGWNDHKVYAVDLDTLTIADTITLPTTGYTTVAIDDVNQIAYILQRDSYPSTEEYYNFIVYDYGDNNLISTKKLTRAFAAIQAVEFFEGKIYVLNGLGTSAAPNYYLVYNTSGDIISEYVMNSFSAIEPEGIFINRATKEIYMSLVNKHLYKIL